MRILIGRRGSGKTHKLIEMAKDLPGDNFIVVSDKEIAKFLNEKIILMGYKIPHPITFYEFIEGKYDKKNLNFFLIDDISDLCNFLAAGNGNVHACTYLGEIKKQHLFIADGRN